MTASPLHQTFRTLRQRFLEELPQQLDVVDALLDQLVPGRRDALALNDLHIRLQQLTGATATFDHPHLSAHFRPWCLLVKKHLENHLALPSETLLWMRSHCQQLRALVDRDTLTPAPDALTRIHSMARELGERRILILTNDHDLATKLEPEIRQRGGIPVRINALATLRQEVNRHMPASLLIDLDGLNLSPENAEPVLIAEPWVPLSTPVPILVTATLDSVRERLTAMRLGSTHFLTKPIEAYRVGRQLAPWTTAKPLEPFRVLLVDDDTCTTRFHAAILEDAGMITASEDHPLRTIATIERFRPDLLVLDLYLPGCNGIELATILRQHRQHGELPILFLSAEWNLGRRLSDQNLAHEEYLIKPIRPTALIRAVHARIRQARSRRQLDDTMRSALKDLDNIQYALNQHAIVSAADAEGRITFVNDRFCQISGYTPAELIGQNHRILNSGYHPPSFFQELWRTISCGQAWHGQVKNRRQDGSCYWVAATIVPFLDETGRPQEYLSIRTEITLQKEAEEKARSMALFAEMNPSPVWRTDAAGRLLESNPAARQLLGLTDDQAATHLPPFLIPSLVAPATASPFDLTTCIRQGETRPMIATFQGRVFQVTFQGVTSLQVGHFYATDITDLHAAQEALQTAKEYAENLIQSSLDMIISVDLDRHILSFNRAAERTFGYRREEVLGRSIDLLFADPSSSNRPRYALTAAGEFKGEVQNRRKDGEIFYSYLSSSPIRNREGKIIGFMGISRDITERKMALEVLRESELRTRAIVESALEGIILADEYGIVELFNPAAERIFGYAAVEVVGRNLTMLMPPPDRDQHDHYLQAYRETGTTALIGTAGREVEGLTSEGRRIPISLSVSAFHLGGKRMFAGVVVDISARRQAEMELRLAKEEAEKASRAKSDFLSSMSHELRTPMNAVLGFAQLLESDPLDPLTSGQQDSLREILKAGQHLLNLINEILDLAKIEAGKLNLVFEDVPLREVLEESLALVAGLAGSQQIAIRYDDGDRPCSGYLVQGDRTRLKQVMINLLSNAIKYNRTRGTVAVVCTPGGPGRVRLAVNDTGIGIPADRLDEVFAPFSRLNAEKSKVEGTGIGLVIAKRLVESMGGTIGVESQVGVGSTFWVELIVVARVTETAPPPSRQPAPHGSDPLLPGGLVLLYVEDAPAHFKLVERLLRHHHPEVTVVAARDPESGLRLAVTQYPDLILWDLNLPGPEGLAGLQRLLANPVLAAIPLVVIGSDAVPAVLQRPVAISLAHFLTKPLHLPDLIQALDAVCQQARRRTSLDGRGRSP